MKLETKIDNLAVKKRLVDLESDDPKTIKDAVNYLARQDKNRQLKTALREIVENFRFVESLAAIWAAVILGIMRDREAVPYLLDVFESDEDYTEEAAMDALIQIENAYPDSVIPAVFEFIIQRADNDPNYAKIFAFGVLEPFIAREKVKKFTIKMFEHDGDASDYTGDILVKTKDKMILELFKRKLVFADQSGFSDNEMKWHYYYLANGISYGEKISGLQDWKKNWEDRWRHLLEKAGKGESENDEDEELNEEKIKEEIEKIKKDFKKTGADKELQKELAARDAQIIEPFCLVKWLQIRERADFEEEFQRSLDLIGADGIWQVEDIQKEMNENRSFAAITEMVSGKIDFPSEKSLTVFIEYCNRLWNETPREELGGLTPGEKMQVCVLAQDDSDD